MSKPSKPFNPPSIQDRARQFWLLW